MCVCVCVCPVSIRSLNVYSSAPVVFTNKNTEFIVCCVPCVLGVEALFGTHWACGELDTHRPLLLHAPSNWSGGRVKHMNIKLGQWKCPSLVTGLTFNSIQFILYSPLSQICLRGLYSLYTYDIPDLWPHIGSGKNSQKIGKKLSQGKKREETFRRAREEDPSPGWTEDIDVMWPEGIITEFQHMQWVWVYE